MCMKRRKTGLPTRMDEIVSYFSKDLIGARSGEITKEDLEELIVILKRGMPKKQQDGSVLYEPSADSAEIIESLSEELRNAPNEEYIPIADYDPTFHAMWFSKTVWNKIFMCLPMKIK